MLTDWQQMAVAEPGLADLERDVIHYAATTGIRDEWERELVWSRAFKPRMDALVGWKSGRACLQASASWHAAYDRLYGLLMVDVEVR